MSGTRAIRMVVVHIVDDRVVKRMNSELSANKNSLACLYIYSKECSATLYGIP